MSCLVDSNIIIDYLRQATAAVSFIHALPGKPSVAVVSVAELFAGARSRQEERRIDRLLDRSNVLPVTRDIARIAGQYVKHYQRSYGLDDFDALIAATAEHHALSLATLNIKHFPMIKGLKLAY